MLSGFRSGPSRKPVTLIMYNASPRIINIIWLDYSGRETNYGSLKPRCRKTIFSFEGHPWTCRDVRTKRKCLMNSQKVFIPTVIPAEEPDSAETVPVIVLISSPIISLQKMCVDAIALCLSSKDHATTLNIPIKLSEDIQHCWQKANT